MNTGVLNTSDGNEPRVKNMHVVQVLRDTSLAAANVAYTGYGFKPTHVLVLSHIPSTNSASWGWSDGTTQKGFYDYSDNTPNTYIDGGLATSYQGSGTPDRFFVGVASFDTDGLTLAYTKGGTLTGNLYLQIIAFR